MSLPDGFSEDYQAMTTRFQWAVQRGESIDMPHARMTVEDVGEFLGRWRGKILEPQIQSDLEKVDAWVLRMKHQLEAVFLTHLVEVLEARRDWQIAELCFKASTAFIAVMQEAPPEMLPELRAIYREHAGQDYNPTREYRQSEADAETGESAYRQTLREFALDWAERLTPELRRKLDAADAPQTQSWIAELKASVETMGHA